MLILTEKSSVAKDFALALNCTFSSQKEMYCNNKGIEIVNCIGHLFKEEAPCHYGNTFPVIPEKWDYKFCDDIKLIKQAKIVLSALKENKNNEIIIATDADREGEIIARECLLMAEINNISKIKRFWVSQALTKEVILEGLKNAKPLSEYNFLASQGFARQHADYLVGMNFCRYISNSAGTKFTVGRVQTAVLSAIDQRCLEIKNFVPKKYYQFYGIFSPSRVPRGTSKCKGLYFIQIKNESENIKDNFNEQNSFDNLENESQLKSLIGNPVKLLSSKNEKKITNPPLLYNLNELQKEAFKCFDYTADKTLNIIQSLYEKLKCVSYPRTPSRVMGSKNVELCKNIADSLCKSYSNFSSIRNLMNISLSNKLCFNDSKLEAHHALIPLKELPDNANEEQKNIYNLILNRFFESFLPPCEWEKQIYILDVNDKKFKVTGKKIISSGFKDEEIQNIFNSSKNKKDENIDDELQTLEDINWSSLFLTQIEIQEKWTKAPPYFNEASILSFMENPKNLCEDDIKTECHVAHQKLTGLGTPATRHTFIPKLMKNNYIDLDKKNFIMTQTGINLLKAVRYSSIKSLADIEETTIWEKRLNEDPDKFLEDIKTFVKSAVSQDIKIEGLYKKSEIICPLCKKEVRKGKLNWYCSGYKEGCKFIIWENTAGAKIAQKDVLDLCNGKRTGIKHCVNKTGKKFDCHFILDDKKNIKFDFEK